MTVWGDIILFVSVLGIFVFGYFLMGCLDRFIDEDRKAIEKESEKEEPSCVMLTDDMSDREIAAEIREFRKKHEHTRIVLYGSNGTGPPDRKECRTDQKKEDLFS